MASDNLDRLSNSPKEVIDAILARMPIRDAVKTSFLSKGWRYRWMSMPVLVINCSSQRYPIAFVNKLLLLHEGFVSKFELDDFLKTSCSDVDHWILVLSRKMVNDLKLNFQPNDNYQVPSCLFCCQSLRKLELGGCVLKLPSDYRGFCGLTQLILSYVTLTNETFHSLLLKIPLLQTLLINYCKSLTHFNIHALNLKEFTVEGDCVSFNFQNAPNVKVAKIKISLPGLPVRFKLDDDLQGLDRVESLTLFNPFVEFLPTDIVQERLDITYSHLTDVCLHVNFEDVKQILAVLCLCRSAPRLETFKINAIWDRESALSYEENFWELGLHKEDAVFDHLKTVSLSHFKGVKNDMGFVQFILLKAGGLKTFCINWEVNAAMDVKKHVLEKMMEFQRASTICKVVFKNKPPLCENPKYSSHLSIRPSPFGIPSGFGPVVGSAFGNTMI